MKETKGISLIALIITIIVIIILAAIVISMSLSTPESANKAKVYQEIAQIQDGVTIARTENQMPDENGVTDKNKDFTKVIIKNAPGDFASLDGDKITGYAVNFNKINQEVPGGAIEITQKNAEVTFGATDTYIYDADGIVYKTKGYRDAATGETIYTVSKVERPWNGITMNTEWYDNNENASEYHISTPNEWAGLAKIVNDITTVDYKNEFFANKTIYLDADIDMGGRWRENSDGTVTATGTNYIVIGTRANPFAGTFDGQYHKISGVYIVSPYTIGVGIFGSITGTIRNVISNGGYIRGAKGVGGIVGENLGNIQNCMNTSKVLGDTSGGIVGYSGVNNTNTETSITNCVNTGRIHGPKLTGGICGRVIDDNNIIRNCYNSGKISAVERHISGIANNQYNGIISNCYTIGEMGTEELDTGYTGIISGYQRATNISNCYYLLPNARYNNDATGKEVYEMKLEPNFLSELNAHSGGPLDIDGDGTYETPIWKEDTENKNNGYPILYWQ